MSRKFTSENANLFNPSIKDGLSTSQVNERVKQGLTNKTKHAVGKSYTEIILTNVLSFFNILLFCIAGLLIYVGQYRSLLFLCVLIPNIAIGLYEDIKARVLLSKLRLVTQPKATVVRDGQISTIGTKELVLEDVMILSGDAQICADGRIVEGTILVNESLLTGESLNIEKKAGDPIYSGSFVVSGNARAIATKIGRDNYVETIQRSANKFRRSPSQILRSTKRLFKVIGGIVIVLAIAIVILYSIQGKFSSVDKFKEAAGPIAGCLVAMIPSGLYLLTSVALATAVINLSKKNAQVQDFYSVEMLARTDVLCVDKTGTITDGSMSVKKVVPLISGKAIVEIEQIISNILHATQDNNLTAQGMKKYFKYELTQGVEDVLPFNSDNKYSAASFKGGHTYAMGAIDCLPIGNKETILKRSEEYTQYGYRVLLVCESKTKIRDHRVEGPLVPIAFVIMQDNVREDAVATFDWFKKNGVDIKVISGDDAQTVSEVARQAGIVGYDKFISLAHLTNEQVAEAATQYNIFGRVTPEQKEIIVKALKAAGKTVAMTGDGINDILALKRADCSIAMASGSDAARNVSHLVLMDSNFGTLPSVVGEGRRVINNLQRTASLFLTKTCFATFFTIFFLIASLITKDDSLVYPFSTNNLYLWELFGIGITGFFLALEHNSEKLEGSFLKNVFKKSFPAAGMIIASVLAIFIIYWVQRKGNTFTGIYPDVNKDGVELLTSQTAVSMSVIAFTLLSLIALYRVCTPFTKYRKIIFFSAVGITVGALALSGLITYSVGWNKLGEVPIYELNKLNIFDINFLALSAINYLEIGVVVVIAASAYMALTNIVTGVKGVKENDKNQSGSTPSDKGE